MTECPVCLRSIRLALMQTSPGFKSLVLQKRIWADTWIWTKSASKTPGSVKRCRVPYELEYKLGREVDVNRTTLQVFVAELGTVGGLSHVTTVPQF